MHRPQPAHRPQASAREQQAREQQARIQQARAHQAKSQSGVRPAIETTADYSLPQRLFARFRALAPATQRKIVAVVAVLVIYLVVALHFTLHFYPNSNIGSVQVGGMDVHQAAEALGQAAGDYELQVEGDNGISFTVRAHEAGLSLDSEDLAKQALADNSGLAWPLMILLPHDHSDLIVASAESGGFRATIANAVKWYNDKAEAPEDAHIVYNEADQTFSIQPEKLGNMLDEDKITEHVKQALATMEPHLQLTDDDYARPSVYADDERLQQGLEKAQKVLGTNVVFQANSGDVATLKGEEAAKWVRSNAEGELTLDEDRVNEWVQKTYDKSGTVGSTRKWKREDGKQCTVSGGTYGWEADWLGIDEKVHEVVWEGTSGKVDVPMSQEAAAYNGENGRDWKAYIDVDLDEQYARFYDDSGKIIWEAAFVSGAPDGKHNTPTGVYSISYKQSPTTLVGDSNASGSPEYQTQVRYWMCWRDNDIGFHDADWQPYYGGTMYLEGYGSHGCINLSPDAAAELYKLVDTGTVVVCHGDNSTKIESAEGSSSEGNGSGEDGSGENGSSSSSESE